MVGVNFPIMPGASRLQTEWGGEFSPLEFPQIFEQINKFLDYFGNAAQEFYSDSEQNLTSIKYMEISVHLNLTGSFKKPNFEVYFYSTCVV